jgi:thiamine-phosphate pyrophosphorylase
VSGHRPGKLPLPPLVVLTDGASRPGRPLAETVAAAVAGGARAVLVREKHLSRSERAELVDRLRPLLDAVGGLLLVASDATLPSDGVHLAANDPLPDAGRVFGRSCHSRADVAAAAQQGCSWATLSPVYPSASKPGYGPPVGPAALGGLPLPTWALGGVSQETAGACRRAGASGIAVMGEVMRADDPGAQVARLLSAWERAGPTGPPE